MCNSKQPINFGRVQEKCSVREHPVFLEGEKRRPEIRLRFQARSRGRGRGLGGGLELPPEIFRLELNSATKVEFFY